MVQAAPYAAMPRVVQATALLALGKPQEALQSVQQALVRKADSLPALRTGAMACDALGLRDCVCGYTAAVLKRVPKQLISRQLSQKHRCEAPGPLQN
jgi:predicted Zn-dependent protease